jgi:hypothetical protein
VTAATLVLGGQFQEIERGEHLFIITHINKSRFASSRPAATFSPNFNTKLKYEVAGDLQGFAG